MAQIFPIPDPKTEDRMRRALDALQSVERIQKRITLPADAFSAVRRAITEENYGEAMNGLATIIRNAGLQDEATVKDLLDFMSAGKLPDVVDRIIEIFGAKR